MTKITKDYEDTDPIAQATDFFENIGDSRCYIKSCEIKALGCQSKYTEGKITLGYSQPFYLRFNMKVEDGQTSNLCISCTNGVDTIDQDNVVITQKPYTFDDIAPVQTIQEEKTLKILKPKGYDFV